jgi:hypothetical protein
MATKNDFSEGLESRGPLARVNNYVWTGLEVHSVYFARVNQKLGNGIWEGSAVGRVITACGTSPAAADATFTLRGFSDVQTSSSNPPPDLTASGGTLAACKPARLAVYFAYTGLDDITDFIGTWTGPNFNRTFATALLKGDGPSFYVFPAPQGGFSPGAYNFKFSSGGESNPVVHLDATVTLC